MSTGPSIRTFVIALFVAAGAAGCVVAPVGPHGGAYPSGEYVTAPPPGPRTEVIGVAPVAGQVWISGYWGWGGGGYRWVPGYWSAPRHGYAWVPHAWVRYGQGWRMNPGHWRRHY